MHIDEILHAIQRGETPRIPECWGQGRTTFGGLTGAVLCQAAMKAVDEDRQLKSLEVCFTRPFEALQPYRIETDTLACGKTVTIVQVQIVQGEKVRAVAQANFVRRLNSDVHIDPFTAPNMLSIQEAEPLNDDALPEFFGRFEARVATSAMPFSGAEIAELGGWMRFAVPPKEMREPHLVCLIDSWPPTASPYYVGFKPLSTINWSIHFAHPATGLLPKDFVGYLSAVNYAEGGVSSSSADIWHPDGQLLAKSIQTSIIYD